MLQKKLSLSNLDPVFLLEVWAGKAWTGHGCFFSEDIDDHLNQCQCHTKTKKIEVK